MTTPRIGIIGGPNGAGKSTIAPRLIGSLLEVDDFVNADEIARGLSGLNPGQVAFEAGSLLLRRVNLLAAARKSFGFESTLSGRSLIRWLNERKQGGYEIFILYIWLADPRLAVARVAQRIDEGGHSLDEATIRRRYSRSLKNFMSKYMKVADRWWVYNNSTSLTAGPKQIAHGRGALSEKIVDDAMWDRMKRIAAGT